jgi:two-component system OmpR family response regulator
MDILVALEHHESCPALVAYLRQKGFGVAIALDEQVCKLVRSHSFDAFLLAANDSTRIVRLCRQLRNRLRVTAPVIAIGNSELQSKLDSFEAGVDDYLAEPIAHPELELRLTNRVRKRRARASSATLQVHGITLDTGTWQAHYGMQPLQLSPKEFRLLQLLMREFPHSVSVAQMQWEIWGDTPPSGTASLRSMAYKIRRQLRALGSPLIIESLPAYACRLTPI